LGGGIRLIEPLRGYPRLDEARHERLDRYLYPPQLSERFC